MLEAKSISFSYGTRTILENVSLEVLPMDRLVIEAPSGRGKTTLCRILSGYIEPDSGRVLVDGIPLPEKGKSPVQLIGQHPEAALDPRCRIKVSLGEVRNGGDIDWELCDALGIRREWLSRFPQELSGGEMQRICIARALSMHPRYLICDEISTMLDALTQAQIWNFLMDYASVNQIGIAAVTHSPALAERIATRRLNL